MFTVENKNRLVRQQFHQLIITEINYDKGIGILINLETADQFTCSV